MMNLFSRYRNDAIDSITTFNHYKCSMTKLRSDLVAAGGRDQCTSLIRVQNNRISVMMHIRHDTIVSTVVTLDEDRLAIGHSGGLLEVFSMAAQKTTKKVTLHRSDVSYLFLHPKYHRTNFPFVFSAGDDNQVLLFNSNSFQVLYDFPFSIPRVWSFTGCLHTRKSNVLIIGH